MKNLKTLIIKAVTLSFFVLCLLTTIICAQENNELQLYNRNEKVQLSKALIHKNDDYYISVDDLSKINIQYKFEEDDEGFNFSLFSQNVFGTEHTLLIDARADELYKWDDTTGDFVSIPFYWFSNSMISKESSVNPVNIGDFQSVVIEEGVYYISLKAISIAISHEYSVSDNIIKLWITDSSHHVVSGEISLPNGEMAAENEINVNILLLNADADLTENYSFKQVCIPKGLHNFKYHYNDSEREWYFDFWHRDLRCVNINGTGSSVNEEVPYEIRYNAKLDMAAGKKEHFGLEESPDEYSMSIGEWGATYHYTVKVNNTTDSDRVVYINTWSAENMIFGLKNQDSSTYATTYYSRIYNTPNEPTSTAVVNVPKNSVTTFEFVTLLGGGLGGLNHAIIVE